ncbi:hypothetical protein E2C01_094653 [Portunus trituberculatus]|uniref:Uncharacterized protein n=1 Tax=Portunus trituberculatus TaxID=210409 RepID=A0A5B7JMQ4_PORTR|nr:hypothetical protein [Portunus trituberculatus]
MRKQCHRGRTRGTKRRTVGFRSVKNSSGVTLTTVQGSSVMPRCPQFIGRNCCSLYVSFLPTDATQTKPTTTTTTTTIVIITTTTGNASF